MYSFACGHHSSIIVSSYSVRHLYPIQSVWWIHFWYGVRCTVYIVALAYNMAPGSCRLSTVSRRVCMTCYSRTNIHSLIETMLLYMLVFATYVSVCTWTIIDGNNLICIYFLFLKPHKYVHSMWIHCHSHLIIINLHIVPIYNDSMNTIISLCINVIRNKWNDWLLQILFT